MRRMMGATTMRVLEGMGEVSRKQPADSLPVFIMTPAQVEIAKQLGFEVEDGGTIMGMRIVLTETKP